ncbi:MAG: hypothetical protein WCL50_09775, partial [Spirochaetota bacterium]
MFFFLILAIPLAFILLAILVYPRDEMRDTRKALIRGLAIALPLWYLARLLGQLIPTVWGSPLLAFHEWFDRILPYAALPALGYGLFWRFDERLDRGQFLRRLTAFYAASLAPIGLGEMARSLLAPDPYVLFLLPLMLGSIILALPLMIQAWLETWTLRRVLLVAGFLLGSSALALAPWFLLARNGLFSWLLVLFML